MLLELYDFFDFAAKNTGKALAEFGNSVYDDRESNDRRGEVL